MKFYEGYNQKLFTVGNVTIFPIGGCRNQIPLRFTQEINNYTESGRELVHRRLNVRTLIEYLLSTYHEGKNLKLFDNGLSLIAGQNGKCGVTGEMLNPLKMELHHKKRRCDGGTDEYDNLVWLDKDIHKLVHATKTEVIEEYLKHINLDNKNLKKLNKLRSLAGNYELDIELT